jgi:hypothetical protein
LFDFAQEFNKCSSYTTVVQRQVRRPERKAAHSSRKHKPGAQGQIDVQWGGHALEPRHHDGLTVLLLEFQKGLTQAVPLGVAHFFPG